MKKVFAILCCACLLCGATTSPERDLIAFGNEMFRYELSIREGRIRPVSYYDAVRGMELLDGGAQAPYFEFSANGRMLSSEQPVWKFKGTTNRAMANGGAQLTSRFEGTGAARGIELTLDHQYFPGSPLVRERMRLRSLRGDAVRLTNVDGKNHFVYPTYTFKAADGKRPVTEIRMAGYNHEVLEGYDPVRTYDNRPSRNLAGCHMFHTSRIPHPDDAATMKGPFAVIPAAGHDVVTSYEHASQDKAVVRKNGNGALIDASQGVKGELDYTPTDDDYWFIATHAERRGQAEVVSQQILRGGYLDGEALPTADEGYRTVWSTINFVPSGADYTQAVKHYLLNQITEHPLSRRPSFYYNTWGMQRDSESEGMELREIFNEKRILEEIDYAAQLGVDVVVLDDGWEQTMGVWRPHDRKLPEGFAPLVEKMRAHGITPGAWLSLMGIDSTSARYREHRDWVILGADMQPISAQWDHPAFDICGGFYDLILDDHKYLIDQGFRFFKWDAINTFNSFQPGVGHGDESHSRRERIDRYNYLVPFRVVDLMRDLRLYNPEVVVEIDLTEPERAIVGLMPLQEGKLFWMNNGASGYGDYSTLRTKSMRNIINQTGWILPPEIFTYAEYPHNAAPYFAQRYNVNTTLVAGRGLWGNLRSMTEGERRKAGALIGKAKLVATHIAGRPLRITGRIGSSPEIYVQADPATAYGQVIGFSGSAVEAPVRVELDGKQLLGVLNHAFTSDGKGVSLDMQFTMPDDTREAFILGNGGSGVSILSSTGWLDRVEQDGKSLKILTGAASTLKIKLPGEARNLKSNVKNIRQGDMLTIEVTGKHNIVLRWE